MLFHNLITVVMVIFCLILRYRAIVLARVSFTQFPSQYGASVQPASNNITSLTFAVIVEQQFQLQAGNVTSVGSPLAMEQQVQPALNHAALFSSPVTVEYQQHEGLNNATLVSSLIQQQSQSNSPYLKITFQYNSFNETFINSECRSVNSYEDKLPEQIKVYLIATTSETSTNNSDDHNGIVSSVGTYSLQLNYRLLADFEESACC